VAEVTVEERTLTVDGVRLFYRQVEGEGTPTVYCHGNPTHSEDWLPFLREGGAAIAIDMPGWGRSDRPTDFDYTMRGLSAFLYRCLDQLGVGNHNLVVHDWGSLALIEAQRRPQAVRRLVVINAVPLFSGYRWHWVARLWRRRGVGEILNATSTRAGTALLMRQARGDRSPMPKDFVDMVWRHWDRGTRRAVLQLYRDADPPKLADAGAGLAAISCPALVIWGEREPYLPVELARRYAELLPDAEVDLRPDAGHWPWLDDPSVVDRVLAFVA
jgi:pimeloyl-ACP methyl ester carboxylesterase